MPVDYLPPKIRPPALEAGKKIAGILSGAYGIDPKQIGDR
jgi:hypothetical protein